MWTEFMITDPLNRSLAISQVPPVPKGKVYNGTLFTGVYSDDDFRKVVADTTACNVDTTKRASRGHEPSRTLAILFGSPWCKFCHTTFSTMFQEKTDKNQPGHHINFAVANVAYMHETVKVRFDVPVTVPCSYCVSMRILRAG